MQTLNFDGFPHGEREAALKVREVLRSQDESRIQEHLDAVVHAPNGALDNEHFARPAAIGLLIYGANGLQILYQLATTSGRLKDSSSAVIALLSVALQNSEVAVRYIENTRSYLEDEEFENLKRKIIITCQDTELPLIARRLLSRFIHYMLSDPTHRISLFSLVSTVTAQFLARNVSSADDLFLELLAKSTLNITEEICSEFAELISQNLGEEIYQNYLRHYPSLLDPLASSIVDRQYLAEMWRTDFVIRRLDNEYIFVEIEKPQDKPFTDYPQPSVALSHALAQVMNWFIWIEDNIAYAQSHGFPGIHQPRGVIIIGRRKDLNAEQIRMLKGMSDTLYPRITILTYDDIIHNARNIVNNLTSR